MGIEKGRLPDSIREAAEIRAREKMESNADFQRRNRMNAQERGQECVERLTKLNMDFAQKNGRQMREKDARALAEHYQNNYDRGAR